MKHISEAVRDWILALAERERDEGRFTPELSVALDMMDKDREET